MERLVPCRKRPAQWPVCGAVGQDIPVRGKRSSNASAASVETCRQHSHAGRRNRYAGAHKAPVELAPLRRRAACSGPSVVSRDPAIPVFCVCASVLNDRGKSRSFGIDAVNRAGPAIRLSNPCRSCYEQHHLYRWAGRRPGRIVVFRLSIRRGNRRKAFQNPSISNLKPDMESMPPQSSDRANSCAGMG